MKRGSERPVNRLFKYGHTAAMSLEEEYVELFQPKEEPIQYKRFTDASDETEQAREQLRKR